MGSYWGISSIIKENGVFKVSEKTDLSYKAFVLIDGSHSQGDERLNNYESGLNNVHFYWGFAETEQDRLIISYKNVPFITVVEPTILMVLDYLKKYCALSEEKIERIVEENMPEYKSKLVEEIEILQQQKNNLEKKIKSYKKIEEKRMELKKLLEEIDK